MEHIIRFYMFLPPYAVPRGATEWQRTYTATLNIFTTLTHLTFAQATPEATETLNPTPRKGKQGEKKRNAKLAKQTAKTQVDDSAFRSIGVSVPTTQEEATGLEQYLCDRLHSALQVRSVSVYDLCNL